MNANVCRRDEGLGTRMLVMPLNTELGGTISASVSDIRVRYGELEEGLLDRSGFTRRYA